MNASLQPPTTFYIDIAKIEHYLLNLAHPVSKAKAAFFTARGFAQSRPDMMASALFDHVAGSDLASTASAVGGVKYIFEGPLTAPNGSTHLVRSIWIVRSGATAGEFVTAYKI